MPHDAKDGYAPSLDLYLLEASSPRPAVLICPGGGYRGRAVHEGKDVAQALNAAGYHALVVQYRVFPSRYPAALSDISRAIRIARSRDTIWNIDPSAIAVMGFSAGGHLTANIGVHHAIPFLQDDLLDDLAGVNNRPDAIVLGYPVISAGYHRHVGSYKNLLGEEPDPLKLEELSLEKHVTDKTPPAFIWHTVEDAGVPVENSILFAQAMRDKKIPFALHLFPHGRHGLGLAKELTDVREWFGLCVRWMDGVFGRTTSS
jgi:acetyl esterase/lipase